MGHAKRHHLVAAGYLRAWSSDGRRVMRIDKKDRSALTLGVKDIFVVSNLLTVRDEEGSTAELETAFGRVENRALPLAREFAEGANDEAHRAAIKALMAVHFARSASVSLAYDRLRAEAIDELRAGVSADFELNDAYMKQYGRVPTPEDLRVLLDEIAARRERENIDFVEQVERMYHKALEYFEPVYLERVIVAKPHRAELLVSDAPVVVFDGPVGTVPEPVALMQADTVWFPLTPSVGVAISTDPRPDLLLDDDQTRRINRRVWDYAARYLVARDGSDPNRAIGYLGSKIEYRALAPSSPSD